MASTEVIEDLKKYVAKTKADREEKAARFENFRRGYNEWRQERAKAQSDGFWHDDWSGYSEPYDYTNF